VRVVVPIPTSDFEPSEVAVSWKMLKAAGHDVAFATPDGRPGTADELMLTGRGLDLWGFLPGARNLAVVGRVLRADAAARAAYEALERDPAFGHPLAYGALNGDDFDALLLPGGHRAAGMRPYLESEALQSFVADVFDAGKPAAAICHGVVVAARARSKKTGNSVLHGRRTTALTWALERRAWTVGRVFRFWDPAYYRTYLEQRGEPPGFRGVQAEVTRALARPQDFLDVPSDASDYAMKVDGRHRDSAHDERAAFVVRDGNYVSGRWPGDAHTFARTFCEVLARHGQRSPTV
jgi:putative intracellular protease/amidase